MKKSSTKCLNDHSLLFFFIVISFTILISSNNLLNAQGAVWEHVYNNPKENKEFAGVASNNTRFVAIGYGRINFTSSDGLKWKSESLVPTTYFGITFGNGRFVAVGYKGSLITSGDGINWTSKTSGVTSNFSDVVYAADKNWFLATAASGQIAISKNGGTTFSKFVDPDLQANDVTYGQGSGNASGRFVAAGGTGSIFYSDDGENWIKKKIGSNHFLCATFGNGTFIVAGKNDIYSSTDGVNWAKRATISSAYFHDVSYTNFSSGNLFVAVGETLGGGAGVPIYTSTTGTSWTKRTSNARSHLISVASKANSQRIVAVGVWSTIVQSDTIAPTITVTKPAFGIQPTYVTGSTLDITWTTSGTVGNLTLEYSTTGGGGTYTTIAESVSAASGSYSWTVPSTKSTNCIIRVSETDGSPLTHSAPFTISDGTVNTIKVNSPNGGETLIGGTTHNITWTSSTSFNKVDIEYYNGSSWVEVVTGTADDGSYTWSVPNIAVSNARIWIKGWADSGNATDYSDSTFTITGGGSVETIDITAPNGGETLTGQTSYEILWNSSATFDAIDIEYYDGSKWNVIVTGTNDDGSYTWTVPNISTTKARLWIKGWDNVTNPTDYTDDTFSIIQAPTGYLTLTSPNGGEVLVKNSTADVTWTSEGEVGNVALSYSTDGGFSWNTIASSTSNDGTHNWSLPNIISDNCLVKVNDVSNPQISDISNSVFSIGGPPEIALNRSQLNFGYAINGVTPCSQNLLISNKGGGTLNWTASSEAAWVTLTPSSGNGNGGNISVSIDPSGLSAGTYTTTVSVSDPEVDNSPQTVDIYLIVKTSSQDQPPFGTFATPEDGLTGVSGSIAVTGWVLDDICLQGVKLYREVNGGLSEIGNAIFVEGARPDLEQAYPDYPNNYKAGWGYMLLTNFLPEGQLILKAIATDNSGQQTILGTKTITLDNTNAVKPFGAIDFPGQGSEISGTNYRISGWALTPLPNIIPQDGSTINVYIDGTFVDKANYNFYRDDIALAFPGYANSNGSWAYLDIDTTTFSNGIHTVSFGVTDNAGNSDGIGSRYFSIQNSVATQNRNVQVVSSNQKQISVNGVNRFSPIMVKKGFSPRGESALLPPDDNGVISLMVQELDRIEIQIGAPVIDGYLVVGNKKQPLPVGSSLDKQRGIFNWQIVPAFLGQYELEFLIRDNFTGEGLKKRVQIHIDTKKTE